MRLCQTGRLESAIRLVLARIGTCTLKERKERVLTYSWNQMFAAVDRLSGGGTVPLPRPDSSGYRLSLASRRSAKAGHVTQS